MLSQEKNAALDHDAEDKGSIERKQRSSSPTADDAQDDEEGDEGDEEDALVQLDLAKAQEYCLEAHCLLNGHGIG